MELKKLRREIDKIDRKLIDLLVQRKSLVQKVGLFKKKHNLPIFNKAREKEIAKKLNKWAIKNGLRKTFLQKIWGAMIEEAKLIEKKVKHK
ncbi:MAG: hypothetical protein A2Y67_01510 [Candidatus Buchananbacteria bacterium RBG_13_39_9]|uniref:Chorismate mutase domain-containing protein n=1 Tax=Candidatus Buchananbacteria bacterium RBG_13_39_9 TaxID=1797531 RepID=A0A1G1XRV9_9BACT|nr:MAG: hypothetical protein A2Y67_01510 [Candidatus Buchananbacteria bacterium RBG_13_39_9]